MKNSSLLHHPALILMLLGVDYNTAGMSGQTLHQHALTFFSRIFLFFPPVVAFPPFTRIAFVDLRCPTWCCSYGVWIVQNEKFCNSVTWRCYCLMGVKEPCSKSISLYYCRSNGIQVQDLTLPCAHIAKYVLTYSNVHSSWRWYFRFPSRS